MKKISLLSVFFILGLLNGVCTQKGGFKKEESAEEEDL